MHKRRIFIAINLPENLKKKLTSFSTQWQNFNNQDIRWVKANNLHITLVFIGYVTDEEMYEICKTVKRVAQRHRPFFIDLEKIIVGPPGNTPRMFWLEGVKSQELANMQQELEDEIAGRGLTQKEIRAFRPHITLARFKYQTAKKLSSWEGKPFKAQIPVETIEVMESELRRFGAEYTILQSVELGNGS